MFVKEVYNIVHDIQQIIFIYWRIVREIDKGNKISMKKFDLKLMFIIFHLVQSCIKGMQINEKLLIF